MQVKRTGHWSLVIGPLQLTMDKGLMTNDKKFVTVNDSVRLRRQMCGKSQTCRERARKISIA
jgi:hypothetical protein